MLRNLILRSISEGTGSIVEIRSIRPGENPDNFAE